MPVESIAPCRIVQISDCHVSADHRIKYRGLNADETLSSLLPPIRAWRPQIIMLTGDVSEDGSPVSYARVAAMLDTVDAQVLGLPGNHDDPEVMSRYFHAGPWGGPFIRSVSGWDLVLLDSTRQGLVSGKLPRERLAQLREGLRSCTAGYILVALHHQPVAMGSQWIDRYMLEKPEQLFEVLDSDPRVRCVVWGHVHQDFKGQRKDISLLGSPSSVANSLPRSECFKLDPEGPSCRWVELHPNGQIDTGVLRPDQSSTGRTSQRIR